MKACWEGERNCPLHTSRSEVKSAFWSSLLSLFCASLVFCLFYYYYYKASSCFICQDVSWYRFYVFFIKKHGYLQNISNLMRLSLFISWTFLCEKLRNLIELQYEIINLVQQDIVNCTLGESVQDSVAASVLFPVDMGRAIKVSLYQCLPLQSHCSLDF